MMYIGAKIKELDVKLKNKVPYKLRSEKLETQKKHNMFFAQIIVENNLQRLENCPTNNWTRDYCGPL